MHFLGLAGMPRRYADYAPQFTDFHFISSLGAFAFGLSQLLFLQRENRHVRAGAHLHRQRRVQRPSRRGGAPAAPFHTFEVPPQLR